MAGEPMFRAAPARYASPPRARTSVRASTRSALALALYDDVVARSPTSRGSGSTSHGEGADSVPRDATHLVAKAMLRRVRPLGGRPAWPGPGVREQDPARSRPGILRRGDRRRAICLARALVVGGDERLARRRRLLRAGGPAGGPPRQRRRLPARRARRSPGTDRRGGDAPWPALDVGRRADRARRRACPTSRCPPARRARMLPEPVPHADAAAQRRPGGAARRGADAAPARSCCWRPPRTGCTSSTGGRAYPTLGGPRRRLRGAGSPRPSAGPARRSWPSPTRPQPPGSERLAGARFVRTCSPWTTPARPCSRSTPRYRPSRRAVAAGSGPGARRVAVVLRSGRSASMSVHLGLRLRRTPPGSVHAAVPASFRGDIIRAQKHRSRMTSARSTRTDVDR